MSFEEKQGKSGGFLDFTLISKTWKATNCQELRDFKQGIMRSGHSLLARAPQDARPKRARKATALRPYALLPKQC